MEEFVLFWKNLLANPIRLIAMLIVLIMQNGIVGVMISIAIMGGVTYYLTKQGILKLDWSSVMVQRVATVLSICMAAYWIFAS